MPWAGAARLVSYRVAPPPACAPEVWPQLERMLLRALAYEAADRYADMETFAVALRAALGVMERDRDREIWRADLASQAEAPLQPQSACPRAQVADLRAPPMIAGARGWLAQVTTRAMARTPRALSLRRVEMAFQLNSRCAPACAAGERLKRRIEGWRETLLTILRRTPSF